MIIREIKKKITNDLGPTFVGSVAERLNALGHKA